MGKQIVRSADSVGANIAEGHGRYSCQDNQRFVKIALTRESGVNTEFLKSLEAKV